MGGAAYFDLKMEPGQTQRLAVVVENRGDEEIAVTVETVTASTNRDGNLNYATPGIYDETMPHSFADLAHPEAERLTIPPHGVVEAGVLVTMPEEEYDGLLLGSIRVVKDAEEPEEEAETGIVNRYSYAIGVRLRETGSECLPAFALGEVSAELVNHKAAIVAQIRNTAPVLVEGVAAEAEIFSAGTTEPIIAKRQEGITLAPNTVFPLTLMDGEGYGFPPGEYAAVVRLEGTGEHGEIREEFRREFTIREEEAETLNDSAVNQVQNRPALHNEESGRPEAAIGAALILLVAAVFLLRKRRLP